MFPLFETIKVVKGLPLNLPEHAKRIQRSRKLLDYPQPLIGWERQVLDFIAQQELEDMYRLRMSYGETIGELNLAAWTPKKIDSFFLYADDSIDYACKYNERSALLAPLINQPANREVIFVKHNLITDTSYSNLAFYDGSTWFTPSKPLLQGTQRAKLIAMGLLRECAISPADLVHFASFRMINALLEWDGPIYPIALIE